MTRAGETQCSRNGFTVTFARKREAAEARLFGPRSERWWFSIKPPLRRRLVVAVGKSGCPMTPTRRSAWIRAGSACEAW
jgi:hypothetical protein